MTVEVMNRLEAQFDWQLLQEKRHMDMEGVTSYAEVVQKCPYALEPLIRDWIKNTRSYLYSLCYELYAILATAQEYDRQEEEAKAKNEPVCQKEYTLHMTIVQEMGADPPEDIQGNLKDIRKECCSRIYRITIQRMPVSRVGYSSACRLYYRLYQGTLKTEE